MDMHMTQMLQMATSVLSGVLIMAAFIRAAQRVEPFTRRA